MIMFTFEYIPKKSMSKYLDAYKKLFECKTYLPFFFKPITQESGDLTSIGLSNNVCHK